MPYDVGTMTAFAYGRANRGQPQRVFDWNKAATRIREVRPEVAEAGLSEDWGYTGGTIYEDGKPTTEHSTYLSSNWATPVLIMDGEEEACWLYEADADGCDEDTKWPPSALAILNGSVIDGVARELNNPELSEP